MAWEGEAAFDAALDRIARQADAATKEIVSVSSTMLIREAQSNFSGSHRPGRPHVGGNKPNIVTGQTRRSIRADPITRHGNASYSTTVAPRVKWGRRLELGFRGSKKYPYFVPAAVKIRPELERAAAQIWRQRINP